VRRSFLAKLLLLIAGLVLALQLVTYLAARLVIREAILEDARHDLEVAGSVVAQSLQMRAQQLRSSVAVLVADYGLKEAVAIEDGATLTSALQNHAARIGADLALVVGVDGRPLAASRAVDFDLSPWLARAGDGEGVVDVALIDGRAYQLVVAPVLAPVPVGWAAIGFALDQSVALSLRDVTDVEVLFFAAQPTRRELAGSAELAGDERERLLAAVVPDGTAMTVELAAGELLSVTRLLADEVGIILHLPLRELMQPYHQLSRLLLWVALLAALVAALAAALLARGLTRSVRALAAASQRIAAGEYAELAVAGGDELGELARAFNQMQGAIAEREERILYQSRHDPLTGLPNRTIAFVALQQAIETASVANSAISVLVLDLNRFKAINDSFGHPVGDRVLCEMAQRMRALVKQRDTVVRLDGDEFLLVLEGVDSDLALRIASRLAQGLAEPIVLEELHLAIDVSVGIACYPADGAEPEVLMRRADIAMYSAKQSGVSAALYRSGDDERRLRSLALLHDLREAIANDGLHLVYQPKLNLRRPGEVGAEALLRWRHPQLGPLGPDEFIPIAERSGNIALLTRWVLEQVIAQLGRWLQQGLPLTLSVNIAAADLLEEGLPQQIVDSLARHGVPPQCLCLELTESSMMQEMAASLAMLARLQQIGLRLAIDDFGTGYSSLSQLKKMPVDELKIDKSFVLQLDTSEDDAVIVRSTIDLGHTMGLEVVAEGVENTASRALLAQFGCDFIQGYLISKPLPAIEFEQWVKAHLQSVEVEI
jgi:diguanylate cyclase (GGDEF)-like protein